MTIRSGRVVDGTIYTDAEYAARVTEAYEKQQRNVQPIEEAFKALGFNPDGMNKTNRRKGTATEQEKASAGKSRKSACDPPP